MILYHGTNKAFDTMRRKDTISYLGVWENLHNPNFKSIEFDAIKNASGTNRFILTAAK